MFRKIIEFLFGEKYEEDTELIEWIKEFDSHFEL